MMVAANGISFFNLSFFKRLVYNFHIVEIHKLPWRKKPTQLAMDTRLSKNTTTALVKLWNFTGIQKFLEEDLVCD